MTLLLMPTSFICDRHCIYIGLVDANQGENYGAKEGTYQNYGKMDGKLINRREWIQLKGCVFSRPAPARGREARKRNPSNASLPTAL